ncbi:ArsR/SmtB family transcription factor [Bacillus sp. J33]|uniref:ArsR/SmtB family transcription factor n=1 Tax=Bacillus sp. J33 TaxID=935836 RepID=UPI00047BBA2C|nr:winged helix-turn-helix domain-containing protein [Bacillus sp. J33]
MNPDISKIASLLSDHTRSLILLSLMDGTIHPASELAYIAKVKPQTASFHLHKMLDARLVSVEKHGRHRYYKLVNRETAEIIEQLLNISPSTSASSFKEHKEKEAIHFARTCYDHLAGYVGVQITNSLVQQGFLNKADLNYEVTIEGSFFFKEFGIDEEKLKNKRRAYARCCLDWSERQHHIAGALGNALLEKMFALEWFLRIPRSRAIKITPKGRLGLEKLFSIHF